MLKGWQEKAATGKCLPGGGTVSALMSGATPKDLQSEPDLCQLPFLANLKELSTVATRLQGLLSAHLWSAS